MKDRALCSEASCLLPFSYILAATFFTPLCELLPDYLCERETCLSWWCICSCFFPRCCCRLTRAPGPAGLQGPAGLYWARCTAHPLGVMGVLRLAGAGDGRRGPSQSREESMALLRQSCESSRSAPCHISLKSAFELLLLIFNNQLDKYLPKID